MPKRDFYIKQSELDDYQVVVLQRKVDRSSIIQGCAGSGKSILALHRVKQIQEEKIGSFWFILFTKTLKKYMQDGINSVGLNSDRVTYHWQWENQGCPSADFIIVDEAQDFEKADIEAFKSKARKALILFGDSAQQIMKFKNRNPLSMEEIAGITNIPSTNLMFNHRLPKKIARLAEKIGDLNDELEIRCKNEGVTNPKILNCIDFEEQLDKIINIVRARNLDDVGILFRHNEDIIRAQEYFDKKNFQTEYKANSEITINFNTSLPKLTTFHSSKGLQFEAVFIPECNFDEETDRAPLYVAMTRTYHYLFIMHSNNLSSFFDDIPKHLYDTSLEQKRSERL